MKTNVFILGVLLLFPMKRPSFLNPTLQSLQSLQTHPPPRDLQSERRGHSVANSQDSILFLSSYLVIAQKAIQLQWSYPSLEEVDKFIIFRSQGKKPLTIYKIADPENLLALQLDTTSQLLAFSFMDNNILRRKDYRYQVVARLKKDNLCLKSPVISICYSKR